MATRGLALAALLVVAAKGLAPQPTALTSSHDLRSITSSYWKARGASAVTPGSRARLDKEAAFGNHDAQYLLGIAHMYGDGVEESAGEARRYLRQAAQGGHREARVALAHLLVANQDAGPTAVEEAEGWLGEPARQGDPYAALLLGRLLLASVHPTHSRQDIDHRSASDPDGQHARALLLAAARRGRVEARHLLGVSAEYGVGCAQSFSEAAEHYRLAADEGYSPARYHLALMIAYGRGMEQNLARAGRLFKRGADAGHAPSMLMLGSLLVNGQGMQRNLELGRRWVEKAAASGDDEVAWRAQRAADELSAFTASATRHRETVLAELRRERNDSTPAHLRP